MNTNAQTQAGSQQAEPEGLLSLDDDTPLVPACPMRTDGADEICEACQ